MRVGPDLRTQVGLGHSPAATPKVPVRTPHTIVELDSQLISQGHETVFVGRDLVVAVMDHHPQVLGTVVDVHLRVVEDEVVPHDIDGGRG